MKIVKIGKVIKNWTENIPHKVSFIIVDVKSIYYDIMLENKDFMNNYKIMKSMEIVEVQISDIIEDIAIDSIIKTSSMIGKMKMEKSEKIIDIIENIIITNNSLYINIDKSYAREKIFKKLGV